MLEAHFNDTGQLIFPQSHARCVRIFLAQRGVKHGRIIGGEHDGYSMAKELGKRMIFDCWFLETELQGESGSFHVARRTYFERDFALGKKIH